jgi:hypothetical protein
MTQTTSAEAAPAAAISGRGTPWTTLALSLLMLTVTILALSRSSNWLAVDKPILLEFGSSAAVVTLDDGGLWRLLAAKFQMSSALVALLFLPFFLAVASAFERVYGWFAALAVFIAVSVLTSAVSMLVRSPFDLTSGAGGPTLGFFTCLLVLALRQADERPRWNPRRTLLVSSVIGTPYLLLLGKGLLSGAADHGSLASGVVCGLLCGFLLPPRLSAERSDHAEFVAAMLSAALLAGSAFVVVMVPEPPYFHSEAEALRNGAKRFQAQYNAIYANFDQPVGRAVDQDKPSPELAAEIEVKDLKAWTEVSGMLQKLPDKPRLPDIANLKPMRDYAAARTAFLAATINGWRTDDEKWFIEADSHRVALQNARDALQRVGAKFGSTASGTAAQEGGLRKN